MKECPICKASCFDDMEVCFGCLYCFESEVAQASSTCIPVPASRLVEQEECERGAHRRQVESLEEASDRLAQQLVVIPLGMHRVRGERTSSPEADYQIEINLVPVPEAPTRSDKCGSSIRHCADGQGKYHAHSGEMSGCVTESTTLCEAGN